MRKLVPVSDLIVNDMDAALKFLQTNEELAALGKGHEVRFAATFDDFWELLGTAEYNVEYFNHEIIATMSYETDVHTDITTQMSHLLKKIFGGSPDFRVRNSNRPVCIPECDHAVFNPDGSVIAMPAKFYEYRPGMNAELTPVLLFEVLSKNTRTHDLADKLPCYKKIPFLKQILYIDSQRMEVTVWERIEKNGKWLETNLHAPEDVCSVAGQPISLREIYEDVEW